MRVVETNNYDVLLPKEGAPDERSWRHQNHVGNSRFRIFIDMHARAYAAAGDDEVERDRIASTVVDTICHKCVPNGRFLELIGTAGASAAVAEVGGSSDVVPANEDAIVRLRRLSVNHGGEAGAEEWMDLGDGDAARRRTREALAAAAGALEQQSPPSPTAQKGVTFSDAGASSAVSTLGGGGGEVTTTKRHKRVGGILKNGSRGSPPDVNLADERFNLPQPEQQGGGGRRARRKSSIIVSAFAAATGLLDAEETEECECGVECTGACGANGGANSATNKNANTKKRSRPSSPPRIVKEEDINNYDVLCSNRFGEGILPKSEKETIGNNRFRITVSLHRERYQRSDKRGKCKIVSEIMRGLRHCNPPGRFLTKVEDTPGLWKEVDKRTAFLTTIRTIRGSDPELKKLRNEAVESLKKRKEKQEAMSKLGKKSDHAGLIPEHQQQQQNLASPNSSAVLKMKRTHGRAA